MALKETFTDVLPEALVVPLLGETVTQGMSLRLLQALLPVVLP